VSRGGHLKTRFNLVRNSQCHQTTNATPLIFALAQLLSPAYVLPNQSSLIPAATGTSTTCASLGRRGGRLLNVLVGNYVQGKSYATLFGSLGARDMVVVPLPCQPNVSAGPPLPLSWTSPPREHSPQIPSPPCRLVIVVPPLGIKQHQSPRFVKLVIVVTRVSPALVNAVSVWWVRRSKNNDQNKKKIQSSVWQVNNDQNPKKVQLCLSGGCADQKIMTGKKRYSHVCLVGE
jgi:hypothetical protein